MFRDSVISIDIGTENIKLVVGKQQNKTIAIENAFIIPTPMDSYEDGAIINSEAIEKKIAEVLKNEKIKSKKVIFTIETTSMIMREIIIPSVKSEELETTIRFEVEQYLPIVFEDYVLQYKILEEIQEESIKKLRIAVAVLPKKIVEPFLELTKDLKLKPKALDVQANSISKLFDKKIKIGDENFSLDKTVAIIDFGRSYINVTIIEDGMLRFNRVIPQGGRDIDMGIANAYNLSLGESKEKKCELASLETNNTQLKHPTMINNIIQEKVNLWITDIQRIFQYYTSRSMGNRINDIYVYGGSSKIPYLRDYLQSNLNIPTWKLENMNSIKLAKEVEELDLDLYINAIAAIIRR